MNFSTAGVYGFSENTFFSALKANDVTCLIDVRQRRGVRGPLYRFANAKRLESLLSQNSIGYIAEPELSPTTEMREAQKVDDETKSVSKSSRLYLSPMFINSYKERLTTFGDRRFQDLLTRAGSNPCFFCVERAATACHRGILSSWAIERFNASVTHLTP